MMDRSPSTTFKLSAGSLTLDCSPNPAEAPHVMGILNVTPDSFSDGGRYLELESAIRHAEKMVEDGAVIVDVGGASSRPKGKMYGAGAARISAVEEIDRVVPVIENLAREFPATWISIDTYSFEVASAAVAAGANMLNDITGLRAEPELADLAATQKIPLVLMHSIGLPGEMPHTAGYEDVVEEVKSGLRSSVNEATSRGSDQLILDPGFGFGKTASDNLKLVSHLHQFQDLGYPLLVGISRKSTIGLALASEQHPVPVEDRLFGSLGATAIAALRGAAIVRTHDVKPTWEMLKVLSATLST